MGGLGGLHEPLGEGHGLHEIIEGVSPTNAVPIPFPLGTILKVIVDFPVTESCHGAHSLKNWIIFYRFNVVFPVPLGPVIISGPPPRLTDKIRGGSFLTTGGSFPLTFEVLFSKLILWCLGSTKGVKDSSGTRI
jgi:hypothetical protein